MCYDLGIDVDNFNPKILYTCKNVFNEKSKLTYHCHDFLSVMYVLSGTCTYNINNVPHKVKKGDLIVFNAGVYHGKEIAIGTELIEFQAGFENIHIKGLTRNCIVENSISPIINTINQNTEIMKCCMEIISQQGKDEPALDIKIKALGMKLLSLIIKTLFVNAQRQKDRLNVDIYDKLTIVNTILEFMNDNYMYEISLDIISQNMYLSTMYICKIFKEETGDSPINYLIKLRLAKAKEALINETLSVKEIASSVGYSDVYHFSKLFKKYYGCSPSKLKRKQLNY